jgi:hypothetical protein
MGAALVSSWEQSALPSENLLVPFIGTNQMSMSDMAIWHQSRITAEEKERLVGTLRSTVATGQTYPTPCHAFNGSQPLSAMPRRRALRCLYL